MSDTTRALCGHLTFEANVIVERIEDVGRFIANVQVRCVTCGIRFRWLGLEMGLHPAKPRVSVDEFELRAPIEPDGHLTSLMAGAETGFPSFQIREQSSPTPPGRDSWRIGYNEGYEAGLAAQGVDYVASPIREKIPTTEPETNEAKDETITPD